MKFVVGLVPEAGRPLHRLGGKPGPPPKLGALDSLSVLSAKERSKNGRVVVEDEGVSRTGERNCAPVAAYSPSG